MKRVLITGATGFIGRALQTQLTDLNVLSRNPTTAQKQLPMGTKVFAWQPDIEPPPDRAFDKVDTVFHLAGDPVAKGRWTESKKEKIRSSRIEGTRQLVVALKGLSERPRTLICASASGFYGDRGEEQLEESSPPGLGFLAEVCRDWEAEAQKANALAIRVVSARIGIVLGRGGGALSRLIKPFKMGLGGILGDGTQWMPWVHLDDVVGLLLHAAKTESISGPMNVVAPHLVTNKVFTQTLARQLRRPALLPVPSFALRLALGEFASVLLASQNIRPLVAQQSGYSFQFPQLGPALDHCFPG